jgi:hypothetical protein
MRNTYGPVVVLVLVMLGIASPAAAQFGGLKKKLKAAAGQEAAADGSEGGGRGPTPRPRLRRPPRRTRRGAAVQ